MLFNLLCVVLVQTGLVIEGGWIGGVGFLEIFARIGCVAIKGIDSCQCSVDVDDRENRSIIIFFFRNTLYLVHRLCYL